MDNGIAKDYLLKTMDTFIKEIVVISPELKITVANTSAREIYGQDCIGKTCFQLLFNRKSPCPQCPAHSAEEGNKPLREENDGSYDLEKPVCHPIYVNDAIDALIMFDIDLPRLGKLEEELQRSNSFLKNMLFSAVDGIIAADLTGKIIIFNDAAAEVSGYSVDEALNHLDIRDIYPGDGARDVMRKLRSEEYGSKGKLKAYYVDVLGKNGELIPISLYASIIYEGEREVATIGFFHDRRDRIKIQKELEKTQTQLLQAEKMSSLGKLAAGVAHQLNNPLGGITLYTKLVLEEYDLPNEAREDLQRILKDSERCRDTVRELLEFARQTRYFMEAHNINEAISRTLFLVESQSIFQNIALEKELSPTLPLLYCDIQQLNHLFMNIILNAAEAMEGNGKLTVKSYVKPEKDWICVEITDTGPGIRQEDLPRIFEPFFTTKEEGKGTGLGLSLAYRIVETHRGHITATSTVGEGTTFLVEFPLNQPEDGDKSDGKWIE